MQLGLIGKVMKQDADARVRACVVGCRAGGSLARAVKQRCKGPRYVLFSGLQVVLQGPPQEGSDMPGVASAAAGATGALPCWFGCVEAERHSCVWASVQGEGSVG